MPPSAKEGPPPRLRLKAELRDGASSVCPGSDAFVQLSVECEPTEEDEATEASNFFLHQTLPNDADDNNDDEDAKCAAARQRGGAVTVRQISVEWFGTERLDPAWVKPSPRRGDTQDAQARVGTGVALFITLLGSQNTSNCDSQYEYGPSTLPN